MLDLHRFANSWGTVLPEEVRLSDRPPQWRIVEGRLAGQNTAAILPIDPVAYTAYDIHFLAESWGAKPSWLKRSIRRSQIPFVRSRQIDLYGKTFYTWVIDADSMEQLRTMWGHQFRLSRARLR